MSKMKVAIVGSGSRSLLYIGAAKALSDQFELVSMRFRTQEKADRFAGTYHIPVTTSMDEMLDAKPDFVVVVVNRPDVGKVSMDILKAGVPVLAETPPAESYEETAELWDLTQKLNSKILIAENYFAEPMFAAKIEAARRGYLGDVQTVTVSNTHHYHAASVMRLMMNTGFQQMTAIGHSYNLPITETESKDELLFNGKTVNNERTHVALEFENGKVGFYDFSLAQYWSLIRSRYFMAQGSRGEIKDDDIWYLDKNNRPLRSSFQTITSSFRGELVYISLGDDILYQNPFVGTGVARPQIGVANMMVNMKEYLETGHAKYSFAEGMQDTYMTQLIMEAGRKPWQPIVSKPQPWQK